MPNQIEKLRATLQAGQTLVNTRRMLARFSTLLTNGIPAQGITAQELINIVGQDEANLILAANALFVSAETEVASSSTQSAPEAP